MHYRIAWKDRASGDAGYGILVEDRRLVEVWLDERRRELPDLQQWIEEVGGNIAPGARSKKQYHEGRQRH